MHVPIKRIDSTLPLPQYESAGAAAFDCIIREKTVIEPGAIALLPTNVIVQVPQGYMLMLCPRSSLPRKKLLVFPHSVGIIDQDYCGPDDEILLQVQNTSTSPVTVERGEKIAQGLFVQIAKAQWQEVDHINAPTRGGFGSTDVV